MIKNNGTPILESDPIAAETQSLSPPPFKIGTGKLCTQTTAMMAVTRKKSIAAERLIPIVFACGNNGSLIPISSRNNKTPPHNPIYATNKPSNSHDNALRSTANGTTYRHGLREIAHCNVHHRKLIVRHVQQFPGLTILSQIKHRI